MHPNAYLNTFWRLELKPQIFVAMSFASEYEARYRDVIQPAIETLMVKGQMLKSYRVDISKTGDSILTDIMEGIAHSQMVLADLSAIGRDSKTGHSYRNGNVMYEVGIALACRQSEEVLLVRDDEERFLFDVSTVPHMKLGFTDVPNARKLLSAQLVERLRAQTYIRDARVEKALRTLSPGELRILKSHATMDENQAWGWENDSLPLMAVLPRLLDKQIIRIAGRFDKGFPAYHFTPFGRVIAEIATSLPEFKAQPPVPTPSDTSNLPAASPP
jgi:hypothetical protein